MSAMFRCVVCDHLFTTSDGYLSHLCMPTGNEHVRATDPATSHAAAKKVPKKPTLRVWHAVWTVGMATELTHYECGWRMWEAGHVTDPEKGRRVARLATDLGFLSDTGRTANNRNGGAAARLFTVTEAGDLFVRGTDPTSLNK